MSVSIVVGGQFGSEGKGKVAHEFARQENAEIAVRIGGANSGHTMIDCKGAVRKFRALPTASLLQNTICVIAAGSYIDPDILLNEIEDTNLDPGRVIIDPRAVLINDKHKTLEQNAKLQISIGSTLSGTGAAVVSRIARDGSACFAESDDRLSLYIGNTRAFLRERLKRGEKVVIEGTQGFGLSVLHANDYPYVTSRDTTAAGFLSEVGLSPFDVEHVVMVLRAFPIRVAGNSGPLPNETDWESIRQISGYEEKIVEYTTVTNKVRRVAEFDASVVRAAIEVSAPSKIVLNHVDYIDSSCRHNHCLSDKAEKFVVWVEGQINQSIDYLGFGPSSIVKNNASAPSAITA